MMTEAINSIRQKMIAQQDEKEIKAILAFLRKIRMRDDAILDDMISRSGITNPTEISKMKSHIKNLATFIFNNEVVENYITKHAPAHSPDASDDEKTKFRQIFGRLFLRDNDIDINDSTTSKRISDAIKNSFMIPLTTPNKIPEVQSIHCIIMTIILAF